MSAPTPEPQRDAGTENAGLPGRGLRSGIIGTGSMADVHAHAVRAAGGIVGCVLGRTSESTARAAAHLDTRPAGSLIHLLDEVDVVHVCTPNRDHLASATAALAAGKHVICEKPLATSVAEADVLLRHARAAATVATVPFVYRFYASVRTARSLIAASASPLWLLHGSYLQDWLSSADATNWRVDPELGGPSRAFGDIGIHWCDLMEFTTGHRIRALSARLGTAYDDRPLPTADVPGTGAGERPARSPVRTEDGVVLTFETDRGALGSLVLSQATPGRKNRLWFSFDSAEVSYAFDQEHPESLWIGDRTGARLMTRGDAGPQGAAASAYSRLPAGHPQGYQDAFNAFVADVYAAVRGEAPDGLPTFADGHRAAVLTQAVLDSAAAQSWVQVPT